MRSFFLLYEKAAYSYSLLIIKSPYALGSFALISNIRLVVKTITAVEAYNYYKSSISKKAAIEADKKSGKRGWE